VFKTARCRWNNLFARLSNLLDAGGFNRLIDRNRIKKTVVGAVKITLVDVLVLITRGCSTVLGCSSLDRSLAFGI
jgi:hypothetical protein